MNTTRKLKVAVELLRISPALLFLELRRRMTGRRYYFDGVEISNSSDFGLVYWVRKKSKRYRLREKDGYYLIDKKRNVTIFSPSSTLLNLVLEEDLLDLREFRFSEDDIRNKIILDIGAYLGEIPIAFSLLGAKFVVAYEPVFYDIAQRNLLINEIKNVDLRPYGVWEEDGYLWIKVDAEEVRAWWRRVREELKLRQGWRSGESIWGGCVGEIHSGNLRIRVRSWENVLQQEKFDLAKVDCEGCEKCLLRVPDKILQRIPLWVIEIHGDYLSLINKFRRAGFKEKFIQDRAKIFRFEKIK